MGTTASLSFAVLFEWPRSLKLAGPVNSLSLECERAQVSHVSKYFECIPYRLNVETGYIDYDECEKFAARVRPKIIIAGASAYARLIDYARMRKIADRIQSKWWDAACSLEQDARPFSRGSGNMDVSSHALSVAALWGTASIWDKGSTRHVGLNFGSVNCRSSWQGEGNISLSFLGSSALGGLSPLQGGSKQSGLNDLGCLLFRLCLRIDAFF